jgi:hypothetical protein
VLDGDVAEDEGAPEVGLELFEDRPEVRDEAVEVFRAYGARKDAVVYNARGAVSATS